MGHELIISSLCVIGLAIVALIPNWSGKNDNDAVSDTRTYNPVQNATNISNVQNSLIDNLAQNTTNISNG